MKIKGSVDINNDLMEFLVYANYNRLTFDSRSPFSGVLPHCTKNFSIQTEFLKKYRCKQINVAPGK